MQLQPSELGNLLANLATASHLLDESRQRLAGLRAYRSVTPGHLAEVTELEASVAELEAEVRQLRRAILENAAVIEAD